ncbi:MAG: IS3 family transposase [Clostridiales bacterium]|nr:IS3 family transposase [Clostridiales bacterium]
MRAFKDEYGLNRVLAALGLSKGTWSYAQKKRSYEERHSGLRTPLLEIARTHPEYGYRRTNAELRDRGIRVNRKVVARLHTAWDLAVIKRIRRPKTSSLARLLKETGSRVNLVANLSVIDDFEVLYTDFTEILYRRGRAKAQLMPIIDHSSKLVVGHALGETDNTELALEAWRSAKKTLQRYGLETEGLIVHQDQDGVYLGHGWLYELAIRDKVRVSCSENGAKGNVHMEAFSGRLKSENRLLFWEQDDFASLKKVVNQRLLFYNHVRRHSALGNKSPIRYLKEKGKIPG